MLTRIIWNNHETKYLVDENGNVYSELRRRYLKHQIDRYGYSYVNLYIRPGFMKSVKVHRLVAGAFIPNTDNLPMVNHIDCDKSNNHVSNLEWCDNDYNMEHARIHGRWINTYVPTKERFLKMAQTRSEHIIANTSTPDCDGRYHLKHKLTLSDASTIIGLLSEGHGVREIADLTKLPLSAITDIKNRRTFKYLSEGIIFPETDDDLYHRFEYKTVLTERGAMEIISMLDKKFPTWLIREVIPVSRYCINHIRKGDAWSHLPRNHITESCVYDFNKDDKCQIREMIYNMRRDGSTDFQIIESIIDEFGTLVN